MLSGIISFFTAYLVVLLVVAIALDIAVGKYAQSRGLPFKRFFLFALFLSPLVSFIILLSESRGIGTQHGQDASGYTADENEKCPHCAEVIKLDAKVCKHCGASVAAEFQTIRDQREAKTAREAAESVAKARLAEEEVERNQARRAAERAEAIKNALKPKNLAISIGAIGAFVALCFGVVSWMSQAQASAKQAAIKAASQSLDESWKHSLPIWKKQISACETQSGPIGKMSANGRITFDEASRSITISESQAGQGAKAELVAVENCFLFNLLGAEWDEDSPHVGAAFAVTVPEYQLGNSTNVLKLTRPWSKPAQSSGYVTIQRALDVCNVTSGYLVRNPGALWVEVFPDKGLKLTHFNSTMSRTSVDSARCLAKRLVNWDPGVNWTSDKDLNPFDGESMLIRPFN